MIARKRIPAVLSSDSLAKLLIMLGNPCRDGLKAFDRIRAAGAMTRGAFGFD